MSSNFLQQLTYFLMFIPTLAVHEAAHAWVADRLGDDTPRNQGRLTLNPLAHIDPIGTLLIPGISLFTGGFGLIGWGKAVMVDPSNFRNKRRDDTLVSLAGPASNILLAILVLLMARWLPVDYSLRDLAEQFAFVSVYLGVFNMTPIPPLDGWHPIKNAFRLPEEIFTSGGLIWYFVLLALINFRPYQVLLFKISDSILSFLALITFF